MTDERIDFWTCDKYAESLTCESLEAAVM